MGGNREIILMGRRASGKTSMRSVLFGTALLKEIRNQVVCEDGTAVYCVNGVKLRMWDPPCSLGQSESLDNVFENALILVYVMDSGILEQEGSEEVISELRSAAFAINAFAQVNDFPYLFFLLNKQDSLMHEGRVELLQKHKNFLRTNLHLDSYKGLRWEAFGTSIWDSSLYYAWSRIISNEQVYQNKNVITELLAKTRATIGARELILLERSTLLKIAAAHDPNATDLIIGGNLETFGNLIKQLKCELRRLGDSLTRVSFRAAGKRVMMDRFTTGTYVVMVPNKHNGCHGAAWHQLALAANIFQVL